jgi:hypothetical protein
MKKDLTIRQVYNVEVYVDNLCVGDAQEATLVIDESISIKGMSVKYYNIYTDKLLMIEPKCIVTYHYKKKKYAIAGVLMQVNIILNPYDYKFKEADLEITL